MSKLSAATVAACLVALVGGCRLNGPPHVTAPRLDAGLVIILPGIEGPSLYNTNLRKGLEQAGLPFAFEIYDWRAGKVGASYALDAAASRRRAQEIVARVLDYRRTHPGRPAFVIGHSGGGAIAVFAAEEMPMYQPLDGVITLAPALGPLYDLSAAIEGAGRRMLNCYSRTDLLLLTMTSIGQNFDGSSGMTAGQEGFSLPPGAPAARRAVFAYLRQLAWGEEMINQGNWGGHDGWTNPTWVRENLAPVLREWATAVRRKH